MTLGERKVGSLVAVDEEEDEEEVVMVFLFRQDSPTELHN